jgi:outer membrane immunogenic protein
VKRLLSSVAFLVMLAEAAHAAETPVKTHPVYKAAPSPLVASWTGFYVGGNLGYGVGRTRTGDNMDPSLTGSSLSPAGVIAGAQAGYRFQRDWLVIGAETDFQWSGQRDDSLCIFAKGVGCSTTINTFRSTELDWFGTIRGIAGVTQDNWLWYVTGGYAYGYVRDQAAGFPLGNGQTGSGSARVTQSGWTVGAGVETRLGASNWSAKLEYLYVNLGHFTYDANDPHCASPGFCGPADPGAFRARSSVQDHVVRVGLNYNLGGSQPAAMHVPPTMPAGNWGGFYVGGNFGYGVGHDHLQVERIRPDGTISTVFSLPQSPAGILGGGQAGYRFQRDWLVVGAEADFQWSGQRDSSCTPCFFSFYDEKLNWFGTVRGVAGVAQNSWLWYVTAGYAYGRIGVNYNILLSGLPPALAGSNSTESGWTAGVGVETKLWASNWSVRLEYLYLDLGDVSFDGFCPAETAAAFGLRTGRCQALNNSVTNHVIRVGLNYRFGS